MPIHARPLLRTGVLLGLGLALLVPASLCASGQTSAPDRTSKGQCHALLLGGLPGTDMHARRYRDWLTRFHAYLAKTAGVPAGNIVVLSGEEAFKDGIVNGRATADSVKKAIAEMAGKVKPGDQFILFMVGHGGTTEKSPTLVLPGDDLTVEDLAAALESVTAANQLVLNFITGSGDCLKSLHRADRVNVAATSPLEAADSVYAEFYLRGIESRRADGEGAPAAGAKDDLVTVLEAYNWAACQTAYWVLRQTAVGEAWKLDGKESVEIFKKLYVGGRGQTGTRKLSPDSHGSKPDEIPTTLPTDGKPDPSLAGRRMVLEHAMLEDCGEDKGASALRESGYEPLDGAKEGDPGHLAKRVVIGKAELLPDARVSGPTSVGQAGAATGPGGK